MAALTPGAEPVHKISIIPRGLAALGYTQQRPTGDRYLMSYEELLSKIDVLLGGRVADDGPQRGADPHLQKRIAAYAEFDRASLLRSRASRC